MRRALAVPLLVLALALGGGPARAGELDPSTTSTSAIPASEGGGIIPEPNSGVAPVDSGDRGGAAQTALFFVLLGGVGLIGFLAYRSSVRARRSST